MFLRVSMLTVLHDDYSTLMPPLPLPQPVPPHHTTITPITSPSTLMVY